MCGRYTNTAEPHALEQRFGVRFAFGEGTRRYNVAPTEPVLTVVRGRDDGDDPGAPVARVMRWGLIPPWARDARSAFKMINARAETAESKPAYRGLIATAARRALLPADGFYEWLRSEDRKQPRQPFRFTVDGGAPFALAGLWTEAWLDGERTATVTILTCPANDVVGRLHDRMPVILADRPSELAWLDRRVDAAAATAMCVPLPAARMRAAPANPAVNRSGIVEGPELLTPPATLPGL
ncbi:MAG: SOS response-associated peptidase [Solirubrobacteraceae bacterium]